MITFKKDQRVLAYYQGSWQNGSYVRPGAKAGEHIVNIDGKDCRIIKNEIQYFLD